MRNVLDEVEVKKKDKENRTACEIRRKHGVASQATDDKMRAKKHAICVPHN
jgi:hypothetical protein